MAFDTDRAATHVDAMADKLFHLLYNHTDADATHRGMRHVNELRDIAKHLREQSERDTVLVLLMLQCMPLRDIPKSSGQRAAIELTEAFLQSRAETFNPAHWFVEVERVGRSTRLTLCPRMVGDIPAMDLDVTPAVYPHTRTEGGQ